MLQGSKYDGDLKAGAAAVEAQGSDMYLNKAIDAGNRYRFFYSIVRSYHGGYAAAGAVAYGYNADSDKLGFTFALAPDSDEIDRGGKRVDRSPLADIARMSAVLYECEREREKADEKEAAIAKAKRTGETSIDEGALKDKLDKIDIAYDGTTVNDTYVPPLRKKILDRAAQHIYAAPVIVQVDKNGVPITTARVVRASMPIAGARLKNLRAVVDEFSAAHEDLILQDEFIEVAYNYDADPSDKSECGRKAKFEVVEVGSRIRDVAKDWWQNTGEKAIRELLIAEPDKIRLRNRSVSEPPAISQVMLNFKKYCAKNYDLAAFLNKEMNGISYCADKLLEMPKFSQKPEVKELLEKLVTERMAKFGGMVPEEDGITIEEAENLKLATNMADIEAAVKTKSLNEVFSGEGEDPTGADVTDVNAVLQAMVDQGGVDSDMAPLEGVPM